jgi:hypothetical protein
MTLTAPVELNDDELLAVSGGVGEDSSATSFTGNLSFTQSFNGSITQNATTSNSGSVSATVAASG